MKLLDAGPSERGWHHFENVLRCPRLYAWSHLGGMKLEMSEPLVRGSLLHIALAHHYQRIKEEQTGGNPNDWLLPEDAVETLASQESENSPLWRKLIPQVVDAYFAYRNNWLGEAWEILEVEYELRSRIGEGKHLYTQRADLIVKDHNQKVWIVDHKTAYRINSKTLRQYIMDGQFLGYQMFGRAKYGKEFAGVILNRVKVSSPYDFDRRALEPAPAALQDFVPTLLAAEKKMAEFEGKPIREWPMTLSNQVCYGKYGKCQAYDLCRFGGKE